MTTQLIIDGRQAMLPKNFAVTVKRENSFFTKSGEYTYDATLRLDNPTNNELYGFLHRINKTDEVETKRSAVLIADGHVYCRGTEVITGWTEQTVTIQIVSGESELNYFIGQDKKIASLDMGAVMTYQSGLPADDRVCIPTIAVADEQAYNWAVWDKGAMRIPDGMIRYQPYLEPLVKMIIEALGYTIGENQLQDSIFKHVFFVNTSATSEFSKMLSGWTVKDFLTEIERFCGVVFVTNNTDPEHPTCSIIFRHQYYRSASIFTLKNVVDAYEVEVNEDGSDELSNMDITYDLPDNALSRHQRLPEGFENSVTVVECSGIQEVRERLNRSGAKTMAIDTTTGRKYIRRHLHKERPWNNYLIPYLTTLDKDLFEEIDYLADLKREEPDGSDPVELKIVPAPMDWYYYVKILANSPQREIGCMRAIFLPGASITEIEYDTEEDEDTGDYDIYDAIGSYEASSEESPEQLYVALCNGQHPRDGNMIDVAYLDDYIETMAAADVSDATSHYEGSLMLKHIDEEIYSNGYQIDTRHAITFETYDPNVIDVRQVYVVMNKRFVCRDVEEVITADGRQGKWKGTFYPIYISDEALEKRWVLTHGVWDDHAAWLDDGRWNDNYDGAPV